MPYTFLRLRRPVFASALLATLAIAACSSTPQSTGATALNGRSLVARAPSEADAWLQAEVDAARAAYAFNPTELRAAWVGRRLAYMGRYDEAIAWYRDAIETFPESHRLRRHLGHRLLTIRKIDGAVDVLTEAKALAADRPNRLEPDGAPGPEAEPRSTTHGNIDYHLALGHFLRGEFRVAGELWEGCVKRWARNDDSRVAALHWACVSYRRAGFPQRAERLLAEVGDTPDVIENFAYGDLVELYRGRRTVASLLNEGGRNEAMDYGIARWLIDSDETEAGTALLQDLATRPAWPAFGLLAAEADLARDTAQTP